MRDLQRPSPSTLTATTTTFPTTLTHTPPPPPPPSSPLTASIDFLHAQTDDLHHSIDSLSVSQNSFQSSMSSQIASFQHTILEMLQRYHNPLPPTHNISFGPLNATTPWTGLGLSNPPSSSLTDFSSPCSNVSEVWVAPDDPSLPPPWKGVVDGTTRCLYYWNPETNITQYEKPAYWVPSPSFSPSCSPDPSYPPSFTASNYSFHSQYPNLYSNHEAPAETVINGYTFPTQFPFPNHTHTSINQPIYPQSQSMVEAIYTEFPSFQLESDMNPSVPTFQSPGALNPSVPTFVPQLQFSNPTPSSSFLSMGDSEPHLVPLGLNATPDLAVPTTDTDHSTPTQSPDGSSIHQPIAFEEMAGSQLTCFHLERSTRLQEVSETEKLESMIPLSGFENAKEEYPATTVLRDEYSSKAPVPVELNSSNDAKQQACDHRPLESLCDDIGGLRTLNFKFEVFAPLFDSSHFFIAIPALLLKTMDDYRTISNSVSAHPSRCVFEHASAFNAVNHASLLTFDYERMSLPLTGWFEEIPRSVALVLYEKELQNFLLNSLISLKCFVVADTLPVYESLTRGLGSCHSVLALQMGLYIILHISSSAAIVKPFVLFVFVLDMPNHDTSSTPLFGATYVKKKEASQGFQVDAVHPGNNHFARKMGIGLKNCEQNCDGERTSTNKLVGALEVVGTTAKGQQVQVIAIFIINQPLTIKQMFPLRFDTAMIFLLIPNAHIILILCGMTHKTLDRVVLHGAFWSTQIFKDINPLEPHSTVIIAFVLGVVFYHNMKLQVYPILHDLGLQKHRHVLDYFFMTCTVLALFSLVATMLLKDVNGGNFYLIEVTVIHVVFLCQPRRFSVEIIGSLQVNSDLSPVRYFSGSLVLLPTIDIQSVVHIILQDGLLMILEAERGIDKSTLLLNPSFFALMVRWFLAMLFGDTSAVFESLSILPVNKLVTLKYKKVALDAIYLAAIFYVAFVLFLQQQLVGKFRPNQIVEPPSHYMTKQEILATFWLWLLTTLSGLKVWVINLHSLIMVCAPLLIGNTFFTRELKFDHESHITLTRATAIRLVFHFGEDLHITNSNLRMEYSILRNTKDNSHLMYSTLWCLPLFTCAIPNDVVWSRYWLLDYTSTWDLMIMDDEATLYALTVICKVTTQQSKLDEYMVQNYLGAISTWGCSTYKIETQMMLPVLRVICKVGVLVISILLCKPIVNIASMKTFVFPVPAFYVLHRGYASGRAAILIFSVLASCFEELVKGISTTHALCDDHEGAERAISMPNQTAQVLLFLTPSEGNHAMLNTVITERRMVSAEIFWAHFPIPTYLRHEDMPSFKGGGLVRTISLDT